MIITSLTRKGNYRDNRKLLFFPYLKMGIEFVDLAVTCLINCYFGIFLNEVMI